MALLPLPKKNQGIAEHDLQVKGTRAADSVRRSDTGTQLTLTQGLVPTHPRRTAALQSKIRELKSAIPESPQRRGKGWDEKLANDDSPEAAQVSIPSKAGQGLGQLFATRRRAACSGT